MGFPPVNEYAIVVYRVSDGADVLTQNVDKAGTGEPYDWIDPTVFAH